MKPAPKENRKFISHRGESWKEEIYVRIIIVLSAVEHAHNSSWTTQLTAQYEKRGERD